MYIMSRPTSDENFREAKLEDLVQFLRQKSRQYTCFLVAGKTIASRINLASDAILQEESAKISLYGWNLDFMKTGDR
jgi:hypothetical protein